MSRFSKLEPGGEEHEPSLRDAHAAPPARRTHRPRTAESADTAPAPDVDYDYHYYREKGDGCFFTGDFRQALMHYSRAIQQDGSKPYPWCMQVWCLVLMNQLREADLWALRAEQMFPDHSGALSLKAVSYAARGMARRALSTTDFALTRGGDPLAWLARGMALLEAGNRNAFACLDKILELPASREDWKMMTLAAMILLRYRKFTQALKPLKAALALKDDNFYIWLMLGRCYLRVGMTEQARQAFEQALELNPRCEDAQRALRTWRSPLRHLVRSFRRILPF
ncbi:MAG: hypothetical protein Kow0059_05280 [Candidatus Sumerlaeia bacterium]